MSEISKFWSKRDGYTLLQCAYIALDLSPQPEDKEPPLEVTLAMRDLKRMLKTNATAEAYPSIESGETGVSRVWLIAFTEFYGLTDFFKDHPSREQALELLYGQKNKPDMKKDPLKETERESLLKLILGMAIDSYGYNPASKKNSATGDGRDSIAAALQKIDGLQIDPDTIRKYLKEASERF